MTHAADNFSHSSSSLARANFHIDCGHLPRHPDEVEQLFEVEDPLLLLSFLPGFSLVR